MLLSNVQLKGSGRVFWTDKDVHLNGPISRIELRKRTYIVAIRTEYGKNLSDSHGFWGTGDIYKIELDAAKITTVKGRSGDQ